MAHTLQVSVLPAPDSPLTTIDWFREEAFSDRYALDAVAYTCGGRRPNPASAYLKQNIVTRRFATANQMAIIIVLLDILLRVNWEILIRIDSNENKSSVCIDVVTVVSLPYVVQQRRVMKIHEICIVVNRLTKNLK